MPPELKKGKSGKWYERTADGWVEAEGPASSGGPAGLITGNPRQPSPGRAGKEQIARGAVGLVGSGLDFANYLGNEMYAKKQAMSRRLGFDSPDPGPVSGPSYRDTFTNALGVGPPTTFAGGVGERIGGSLPITLATGGASLVPNLIRDVAGSVSAQYAQEKGAGPFGQAIAGVLGAILVPTRLPFAGARAASDAAESAAPGAVTIKPLSDSSALKIAKDSGVKPDNVRAVARYLQDRIAIDPATGKPKVEEFVAAIDEAERIFGEGTKPLLANAVGDVGGQNISAIQKSILDENAIANSRATGIRDAITEDLTNRIDKLFPRWETESALSDFATLEQSRALAKSEAWDDVPFDEIPRVSSENIKGALATIKEQRPLIYSKLPSETRSFIEGLGDEMSLRDLQDLKADLGNMIEAARFSDDPKYRTIAQVASSLMGRVKKDIAGIPESGTGPYNAAVKATRDYYDLFDPDTRTVRAFTKFGDKEKIVAEVFKAAKPSDEIDNLRRVFDQVPDGAEKVNSIFMRDLIGDKLGDKPIGGVLRTLTQEGKSDFYKKLLGPERYRDTLDVLNGYRIGTSFGIGSANATLATGSKGGALKALAAFVSSPLSKIKGAPEIISSRMNRLDAQQRAALIEEMVFDTKKAKELARIPLGNASEKEVSRWLGTFEVLSARAEVRSSLAASGSAVQSGRVPAAIRQGISSAVVNQGGFR